MEAHAPHGPVHTWKDFFIHIGIVVLGILIALSLENWLEARHHHERFEQARRGVLEELKSNRDTMLAKDYLPYHRANLENYRRIEASGTMSDANHILESGMHPVPFRDIAWRTLISSNVIDLMPFAQHARLTSIYQRQENVTATFLATRAALVQLRGDRESAAVLRDQARVFTWTFGDVVADEDALAKEYDEAIALLEKSH